MSKNNESALNRFLKRNSISPVRTMPLVHSSESYLLKKSLQDGVLKTAQCDVFRQELLYFFVGRPAYKNDEANEGSYWELPSCILFDFDMSGATRTFPFDSGAFSGKRYPRYINMMEMSDFQITSTEDGVRRAIGAFFRSTKDYYRLNTFSDEEFASKHDLDVIEEEILALHHLIRDRSKRFDDRRFSVEVQFSHSFEFNKRKPIFAIFPENYLQSKTFMSWVENYNIQLETYPFYPLRKDYYYSAIYEKLENFYRENGYYEI